MAATSAPPRIFSGSVLRRLPVTFLPAALLTGAVVLALYYQDLSNEEALHEQGAEHQVELQANLIRRELASVESDLLYLADQSVLRDFVSGNASRRRDLEEEYLLFCKCRGVYDQVRFLDADGKERVRVNNNDGRPTVVPDAALQSKAGRYYFIQAMLLSRGNVFVSPFDLNVEHDQIERPYKPVIRFATPVFDRTDTKRGIVALNYLGAGLLAKLASASPGAAGPVWLLNGAGHFLRGPSAQDEWGFMLGHDRTFAMYFPEEWPKVIDNSKGQFRTTHGLFTFRTVVAHPLHASSRMVGARSHELRSDPDAGDPTLVLVGHVPASALDAQSVLLRDRLLILYAFVLILLLILGWYLAYAASLRREQERSLEGSATRLRALSKQLLTAQEDERRSLSRDLHDELGQVVTSVALDLRRAVQSTEPARKDELIGRALTGTERMLEGIHEISTRLRPTLLDDLGLKEAVQSYLADYERRTGIVVHAELKTENAEVTSTISENVYRILQEALTNVAKHARASEVFVGLSITGARLALTVRDTGIGIGPLAALDASRLGVLGMRERAELLDGAFALGAAPGGGTEVRVIIPLSQSDPRDKIQAQ